MTVATGPGAASGLFSVDTLLKLPGKQLRLLLLSLDLPITLGYKAFSHYEMHNSSD